MMMMLHEAYFPLMKTKFDDLLAFVAACRHNIVKGDWSKDQLELWIFVKTVNLNHSLGGSFSHISHYLCFQMTWLC